MPYSLRKKVEIGDCAKVGVRLRLGLYDPCCPQEKPHLVGPVFSIEQKAKIRRIIARYYQLTADRDVAYNIGVFPME